MSEERVYRLIGGAQRAACAAGGVVPWSDDDVRDGFFHLSTATQVVETARRHYADVADLWVLAFETQTLAPALKWEPSRGGALFPHYYGEVPVDLVVEAKPFDLADFETDEPGRGGAA